MSIQINLLPWREALRLQKNRSFFVQLGSGLVLGAILVLIWGYFLNRQLIYQESRNQYLSSFVNQLDYQLAEIKGLEIRRQQIIDRISLIEELQNNRQIAVRIFDQIVYSTPEGVFYKQLSRSGNLLSMVGVGENSDQISDLMRRLEASKWLNSPALDLIESNSETGSKRSAFNLSVYIDRPEYVVSSAGG